MIRNLLAKRKREKIKQQALEQLRKTRAQIKKDNPKLLDAIKDKIVAHTPDIDALTGLAPPPKAEAVREAPAKEKEKFGKSPLPQRPLTSVEKPKESSFSEILSDVSKPPEAAKESSPAAPVQKKKEPSVAPPVQAQERKARSAQDARHSKNNDELKIDKKKNAEAVKHFLEQTDISPEFADKLKAALQNNPNKD